VLRREYTGLFVITSSFPFIDLFCDTIAEGRLDMDMGWILFFATGLIAYLTLRTLKKKTRLLDVEGR